MCENRANIRRDIPEKRVLDALRHHLMDPALMVSCYRLRVESLHEILQDGSPAGRLTATNILQSLISAILLASWK
jgi:hypothetical protein